MSEHSPNFSNPQGREQLAPQLLGLSSLNSFPAETSSSRAQMWTSHMGQTQVIRGSCPPVVSTGTEWDYGQYTFNIKMPCNAIIRKVIPKYNTRTVGYESIRENPSTLVIFEDADSRAGRLDCIEIPRHCIHHQHFGFVYVPTAAEKMLYEGAHIAEGTIIADSPNVDENGDYNFGIEAQVALMSLPGVIEDGIIVSEDFLESITSVGIETRVFSFGKKRFPLNMYGRDSGDYRPFPEIGQAVAEDGIVCALREYDPILAPIHMSPQALRTPDPPHDDVIYAPPGAIVRDIQVWHDNRRTSAPPTPVGMEVQPARYHSAASRYYKAIVDTVDGVERERKRSGRPFQLGERLEEAMVKAIADDPSNGGDQKITYTYRNEPLDDWRIEITVEYPVIPDIGSKATGQDGDKGVFVEVRKREEMPVDMHGNRADIVMDAESGIKRMNMGRLYRQYFASACLYHTGVVRDMYDKKVSIEEIWNYLLGFYAICSPVKHRLLTSASYQGSAAEHVESVVKDQIRLTIPCDNPRRSIDMVRELEKEYPTPYGPVSFIGKRGNKITTKNKVRIGGMYILILEKTGNDWAAVSSGKTSHFGFPAKRTQRDRYSEPGRTGSTRVGGEAESRLGEAIAQGSFAELIEQSNSPVTHGNIVYNLLTHPTPSNMDSAVDRNVAPRGQGRNLRFPKHIFGCFGFRMIQVDPESGETLQRL